MYLIDLLSGTRQVDRGSALQVATFLSILSYLPMVYLDLCMASLQTPWAGNYLENQPHHAAGMSTGIETVEKLWNNLITDSEGGACKRMEGCPSQNGRSTRHRKNTIKKTLFLYFLFIQKILIKEGWNNKEKNPAI